MITIAFTVEAVLFALMGGIVVMHEVHKARARAVVEGSLTRGRPAVEARRREGTS